MSLADRVGRLEQRRRKVDASLNIVETWRQAVSQVDHGTASLGAYRLVFRHRIDELRAGLASAVGAIVICGDLLGLADDLERFWWGVLAYRPDDEVSAAAERAVQDLYRCATQKEFVIPLLSAAEASQAHRSFAAARARAATTWFALGGARGAGLRGRVWEETVDRCFEFGNPDSASDPPADSVIEIFWVLQSAVSTRIDELDRVRRERVPGLSKPMLTFDDIFERVIEFDEA